MWHIGLIAIRIWRVNKLSMSVGASSLMPVMLVIIESGAIYSAALITGLATYIAKSQVQYILADAVREVISSIMDTKIYRCGAQISSIVVCTKMWCSRVCGVSDSSAKLGNCFQSGHCPDWSGSYNARREDEDICLSG